MESKINNPGGLTPEQQVNSLLSRFKQEERITRTNDYGNTLLKDVPFEVLWNTFSRSNWKLTVL